MRVATQRVRRFLVGGALVAGLVAAPAVLDVVPAGAWSWSSTVTLTGSVKTIYHPGINSVYVSASDGEHGWASVWGGNAYERSYSYTFSSVPGGSGTSVHWTVYTSSGSFSGTVGVARPAVGQNAVRDLCDFGPGC